MFNKIYSCAIRGVEGDLISVEADLSDGLPSFNMIGYLSEEVKEAQERVRTALKNAGFFLPPKRITINLSPADIRKEGTAFELAIATAVLCCLGWIEPMYVKDSLFLGELGLNGEIKPVKGVISRVYAAREAGLKRCFLAKENVIEGTVVKGMEIVGLHSVQELAAMFQNPETIQGSWFDPSVFLENRGISDAVDFSDIRGQRLVKRASMIAAAGMHNILYIGPAGTGKTMAARRIPTILPPLTLEESIEVSKIYSICGLLREEKPLLVKRPFRSPHHSITAQALAGGGRNPKPGEISLACHGVLFLDELTEFPAKILDLLRQPLEERKITVSRLNGSIEFPADTMLVAAMNPCKCGHYPDMSRCCCTGTQIRKYLSRISGPLLERIDIGVEAAEIGFEELENRTEHISSEYMRKRVMEARQIQKERFNKSPILFNSRMGRNELEEYCGLIRKDEKFMQEVYKKYGLSARTYEKLLKLARTIADLEGRKQINRNDLSEAVCYRNFRKKYWEFRG